MSGLQEDIKNMLRGFYSISPACNGITQALFVLPLKARTFWKMFPEIGDYEEDFIELFSLRYTEKGAIDMVGGLGSYLVTLYRILFDILADVNRRRQLLRLANLSEDEFKEFDPLRAWIEISLEYLSKADKDALKILDTIITKLSGKKLDEYVSWDEIRKSLTDIKNFDSSLENLKRFQLIRQESSYGVYVYVRNCPLLLEFYSDLRTKLKELLR
jgi:hypothetical protein